MILYILTTGKWQGVDHLTYLGGRVRSDQLAHLSKCTRYRSLHTGIVHDRLSWYVSRFVRLLACKYLVSNTLINVLSFFHSLSLIISSSWFSYTYRNTHIFSFYPSIIFIYLNLFISLKSKAKYDISNNVVNQLSCSSWSLILSWIPFDMFFILIYMNYISPTRFASAHQQATGSGVLQRPRVVS